MKDRQARITQGEGINNQPLSRSNLDAFADADFFGFVSVDVQQILLVSEVQWFIATVEMVGHRQMQPGRFYPQ